LSTDLNLPGYFFGTYIAWIPKEMFRNNHGFSFAYPSVGLATTNQNQSVLFFLIAIWFHGKVKIALA